jgi:signal peptidase I
MPEPARQKEAVCELLTSQQGEDFFLLSVSGSCMDPFIRDGDQLLVARCSRYYPGDLLVFADGGRRLAVHRLLGWVPGRQGMRAMTKADNRSAIDALVEPHHLVGRVKSVAGTRIAIPLQHRGLSMLHYCYHVLRVVTRKYVEKAFSPR